MVFPSIPVYLNSPNCQQQPNQHREANGSDSPQLFPPPPPQAQILQVGSIKPGSTVDQAQIAKISPPKAVLKCPRCESTNTKFCYFNNYSLSQPRHFCKTCRRYWTRGGALRNIPVGGGCRRNKKNKRSRSKSPAPTEKQSLLPNSTSAVAVPSGATYHELIGRFTPQPSSNRAFMASLQNMSNDGAVGNMRQTEHIRFQIGGGGVEHWQLQQFPSLSSFKSANNLVVSSSSFPFQRDHQSVEAASAGLVGLGDIGAISRVTQMPPVKLKGNRGLNLTRSTSVSENNKFYSWTDLSGVVSSSASHLL